MDKILFVFKSLNDDGNIVVVDVEDAALFDKRAMWKHIGTLNAAAWIQNVLTENAALVRCMENGL